MKYLVCILILLLSMSIVSAHGVDVTADTMVIANDTNGQLTKDIADGNGINISVYKFTSEDEVEHILEHSLNNTNKRILLVAYQNTGNEFLNSHPDLSNRIIVVDEVTNDTIIQGLSDIVSVQTNVSENNGNFGLALGIGIIIGWIIGFGCGILIMRNKN